MIEELTTKARQHAALSGAQGPQNYADIAISKSEAYNLQKALDASVLNSVGHEFWLQGLGRFEKKQVVAILDKDTTQLCRGLHGSIWDWTEPIVDKSSGGSRMFPPFIGSIFVPRFHKCRSIIVPVI